MDTWLEATEQSWALQQGWTLWGWPSCIDFCLVFASLS